MASSLVVVGQPYRGKLSPGLKRPHDVICHEGKYIVTNTHLNEVVAITPGDASVVYLCHNKDGLSSSRQPMEPYGIVSIPNTRQNFLFTDKKNNCVIQYDNLRTNVWNQKVIGCPTGIAIDSNGQVFVADCDNRCIHVFDINGRYIRRFGNLTYPWFMACNSENHLYVADDKYGIRVFDDSKQLYMIDVRVDNTSWTSRGIAIDAYDNIFVSVRTTTSWPLFSKEKIVVYDRNHTPLLNFGGKFYFNFVRGLCFDVKRNALIVVDGENHNLDLFRLYQ